MDRLFSLFDQIKYSLLRATVFTLNKYTPRPIFANQVSDSIERERIGHLARGDDHDLVAYMYNVQTLWNHSFSWGAMFVACQIFAGLWGHNFVDDWLRKSVYYIAKPIHYIVKC